MKRGIWRRDCTLGGVGERRWKEKGNEKQKDGKKTTQELEEGKETPGHETVELFVWSVKPRVVDGIEIEPFGGEAEFRAEGLFCFGCFGAEDTRRETPGAEAPKRLLEYFFAASFARQKPSCSPD